MCHKEWEEYEYRKANHEPGYSKEQAESISEHKDFVSYDSCLVCKDLECRFGIVARENGPDDYAEMMFLHL